jgi:hypothetical protein
MATVLVRNLPAITAVDDSDLLIVNDGSGDTYTTSNIRIGDFRASITAEDSTFKKDVTIDGDLGVAGTVTSPTFIGNLQGEAETVSTLSGFTTADLLEDPNKVDGNLYFTLNRFNDVLQATPLARLSDVVLTGGLDDDKATDGDILVYNGVTYRFENVASSAYDQSAEIADLVATKAPLDSPALTGTATLNGSGLVTTTELSTTLASYAPLDAPALTGVATLNGSGLVTTLDLNTTVALYAPLAAPALTGDATLDGSAIATAADLAPFSETFTGHSTRLDALEADPTTKTYVDTADTALSNRLDALEADPTTATAVTAAQAKADANEALLTALRGLNTNAGAYADVDTLVLAIVAAVTPTP